MVSRPWTTVKLLFEISNQEKITQEISSIFKSSVHYFILFYFKIKKTKKYLDRTSALTEYGK